MLKIVLLVILLVGLSAGTFFLVFIRSNTKPVEVPKTSPIVSEFSAQESSSASELVTELSKPIPLNADTNTKISLLENKIKALETSNIQLAARISKLETAAPVSVNSTTTTSASTTSNSKAPQYIYPLGYGNSTTKTDWTEITTLSVVIDPALYSGYSSMQLEGLIRVRDGNGTAYARLYSNGLAIIPSEISTNSWQNTWISSKTFTVSSKKTYTFQVKSLTGYEAFIEDARIKINY